MSDTETREALKVGRLIDYGLLRFALAANDVLDGIDIWESLTGEDWGDNERALSERQTPDEVREMHEMSLTLADLIVGQQVGSDFWRAALAKMRDTLPPF